MNKKFLTTSWVLMLAAFVIGLCFKMYQEALILSITALLVGGISIMRSILERTDSPEAKQGIPAVQVDFMSKELHDLLMNNSELLTMDVRAAIAVGIPITFNLSASFVTDLPLPSSKELSHEKY